MNLGELCREVKGFQSLGAGIDRGGERPAGGTLGVWPESAAWTSQRRFSYPLLSVLPFLTCHATWPQSGKSFSSLDP